MYHSKTKSTDEAFMKKVVPLLLILLLNQNLTLAQQKNEPSPENNSDANETICDGTYKIATNYIDNQINFFDTVTFKEGWGKSLRYTYKVKKCTLIEDTITFEFDILKNSNINEKFASMTLHYFWIYGDFKRFKRENEPGLVDAYADETTTLTLPSLEVVLKNGNTPSAALIYEIKNYEKNKVFKMEQIKANKLLWENIYKTISETDEKQDNCNQNVSIDKHSFLSMSKILDEGNSFKRLTFLRCVSDNENRKKYFLYSYFNDSQPVTEMISVSTLTNTGLAYLKKNGSDEIEALNTKTMILLPQSREGYEAPDNMSPLCNWPGVRGAFELKQTRVQDVTIQSNFDGQTIVTDRLSKRNNYIVSDSFCYQIDSRHARAGVRISGNDYLYDIYPNITSPQDTSPVLLIAPFFKQFKINQKEGIK